MMLGVNYRGPGPSQDHLKRWKDKEKKGTGISSSTGIPAPNEIGNCNTTE